MYGRVPSLGRKEKNSMMAKPKPDYARTERGEFKKLGELIRASMTVRQYGQWLAQQQKAN